MNRFLIIISMLLTACSSEQVVKNFPRSENIQMNEVALIEPINSLGIMFKTDDYLVIYQSQVDSMYFRYYSIDDLHFVLGGIQRGRGPNEFVREPQVRSFIAEGNGFSCIVTPFIKHVNIEEGQLKVTKQDELGELSKYGSNNYSKIAENAYCVSNIDPHQPYEFVLFDKDGANPKWVNPYPDWANVDVIDESPASTYMSTIAANPNLKRFIVFYAFFRNVRMFDERGKMIKDISVEFPFKFPQYEPKSKMVAYSARLYYDDNYIYVICSNAKSSEKKESTELQIWNWNAEPVAILNLDKVLRQFTISPEKRRLYAVIPTNDIDNDKIFWCDLPSWLY